MRSFRALGSFVGATLAAVVVTTAQPAWGQGEIANVAEVVNVIDSFDEGDSFDFTFRVRYGFELTRIKLTQQCAPGEQAGCVPGRSGVIAFRDIARYTEERHTLTLDAVFGLYRDLEVYLSVPLILLDRRSISELRDANHSGHQPGNEMLFNIPFNSADRSGVDQVIVGLSWLPFSQERQSTLPTWLINVEGRFAVGDELRPSCASSSDAIAASTGPGADRLWFTPDDEPGSPTCVTEDVEENGPGISERTNDLAIRMTMSRRYGIVEPYIGFLVNFMFPSAGDPRYGTASDLPLYAETHFGFEVVPWERAERQQFFRLGFHFWGGWNSETLYRGPLFDALGSNPNLAYRWPTTGRLWCDATGSTTATSDDCDPSNEAHQYEGRGPRDSAFNGMTREEGRGTFGGRLTLTLQAAQYVKFALGLGLAYDQEHFITFTDECRVPRGGESADDLAPCAAVGGIFVEEHREAFDDLGHRFRAEETTIFNAFAMVFIQF
jgi:hypothetical protein